MLIVLHHRDQRPPDRDAGAVQRVDMPGYLVVLAPNRACMRRAWKSPQTEHEEISR